MTESHSEVKGTLRKILNVSEIERMGLDKLLMLYQLEGNGIIETYNISF